MNLRVLTALMLVLAPASRAEEPGPSPTLPAGRAPAPATAVAGSGGRAEMELIELMTAVRLTADQLKDYTAVVTKQERFGDRVAPTVTMVSKWARPYRLYLKNIEEPQLGREALFIQGQHNNQVIGHRGSFPDFTVHLDPHGSLAMEDNHHSAEKAALPDLVSLVENNLGEALQRKEGRLSIHKETLWGREVWRLEAEDLDGGWTQILREDETLWDVAHQNRRNMYWILSRNADKGWDDPADPTTGDAVFVPRYYGHRFQLWIDAQLKLPIKAAVYDERGRLYESFEFRDLKVNVGLSDSDFDPRNPDYKF